MYSLYLHSIILHLPHFNSFPAFSDFNFFLKIAFSYLGWIVCSRGMLKKSLSLQLDKWLKSRRSPCLILISENSRILFDKMMVVDLGCDLYFNYRGLSCLLGARAISVLFMCAAHLPSKDWNQYYHQLSPWREPVVIFPNLF